MKLLIAADIFPPQVGGPATYVVTLAKEFPRQGVDISIVSLNPNSDRQAVTVPLHVVAPGNKLLRYWRYFRLLMRHGKEADVLYAMGPVNAGLPALVASWLLRKPLVVKVVGDYAWEQGVQRFGVTDGMDAFQKKKTYTFAVQILKLIESFVVRRADRVITPSNYLKRVVVGWGAKENKVQVIYNAAHLKSVAAQVKPTGEKWIVSVGRLVQWKGMDTLIKLLPPIQQKIPGTKLKILGDGPEMNNLKALVADLKLEASVELFGAVSHDTVLSYLGAADVFVLNSDYEGLSHVVLEAINAKAYALVSNVGGNPETVETGRNGDLFTYNNVEQIKQAIIRVLQHPVEPVTSSAFWEKFKFETMINETKKLLDYEAAHD